MNQTTQEHETWPGDPQGEEEEVASSWCQPWWAWAGMILLLPGIVPIAIAVGIWDGLKNRGKEDA